MLKLNPNATVAVVEDLNQILAAPTVSLRSKLEKHKDAILEAAARVREDPASKPAHKAYIKAMAAADVSPKLMDKQLGLSYAGGVQRSVLKLSSPKFQKYAISGPQGERLIRDVFGAKTTKTAVAKTTKPRAEKSQGASDTLVIRIDQYPHITITTQKGLLEVLRVLGA